MNCFKCKKLIKSTDKFCSNCGRELVRESSLFKIFNIAKDNISELIISFPFGVSNSFSGEEVIVPPAVVDICGYGPSPIKTFLYAGYFIRRAESNFFKEKNSVENIIDRKIIELVDSEDKPEELKELLKKISNYLDDHKELWIGPKVRPFLFLKKEELSLIFEEIIGELLKDKITLALYRKDEKLGEVFLRNLYFGYCLRISLEILDLLASDSFKSLINNPSKYGYRFCNEKEDLEEIKKRPRGVPRWKQDEINLKKFKNLIIDIVNQSCDLKNEYTDQKSAKVNYAAIFCKDNEEYKNFLKYANKLGKIIKDTPRGPIYLIKLNTDSGILRLLKIRKPDISRRERGDADFTVDDYHQFKDKYIGQYGFSLIERDDFEMIELKNLNSNVRVYFSHPTQEELLKI